MPENKELCNECGKELDLWDIQEDFSIHKEQLGYGTIFDGSELKIKLCCACLEKLVQHCTISPIKESEC